MIHYEQKHMFMLVEVNVSCFSKCSVVQQSTNADKILWLNSIDCEHMPIVSIPCV